MINETKLILMSHGSMAEETLKSAQMIVGNIKNVWTVSMLSDDGLSGTTKKLETILNEWDINTNILVIADLRGGTPCNVAMMKMKDYPNLKVVTGLNLAMTIESIMVQSDEVESFSNHIISTGKEAVTKIELVGIDEEEYED